MGRFTGASFGIVLQGTGATAAAAVAARLGWRLNQLVAGFRAPVQVAVYAATGTGLNAETLPVAAIETCEDCG